MSYKASIADINILTTEVLLGSGLLEDYNKAINWVESIPDCIFTEEPICGFDKINEINERCFKREMKERIISNFLNKINNKLEGAIMNYAKEFEM